MFIVMTRHSRFSAMAHTAAFLNSSEARTRNRVGWFVAAARVKRAEGSAAQATIRSPPRTDDTQLRTITVGSRSVNQHTF
jgi:hypothetical protein